MVEALGRLTLGAGRAQRDAEQRAAVPAVRILPRAAGRAAIRPRRGARSPPQSPARCCRSAWNCCRPPSTMRVSSLKDLSLNALGALAGAMIGSAWHVLGARMAPQSTPHARSRAVVADDPRALVHRAAVAAGPGRRPAPAEERRAAAVLAAHRARGPRDVLRRLAGGRAGRVQPGAQAARGGRVPDRDRHRAGGSHDHRGQHAR